MLKGSTLGKERARDGFGIQPVFEGCARDFFQLGFCGIGYFADEAAVVYLIVSARYVFRWPQLPTQQTEHAFPQRHLRSLG